MVTRFGVGGLSVTEFFEGIEWQSQRANQIKLRIAAQCPKLRTTKTEK
jgi:hypothetical protein